MKLSSDLISKFAKITNDEPKKETGSSVFAEVTDTGNIMLDGSKISIPVSANSTITDLTPGDRVSVDIKNHSAIITGNLSSPAARSVETVKIVTLDVIYADIATLKASDATITGRVDANVASINNLSADVASFRTATVDRLNAIELNVSGTLSATEIESKYATIANLNVTNANLSNLSSDTASFKNATASNFNAVNVAISGKLSASDIEGRYANIDFSNITLATIGSLLSESGIITNLVVGDASITGELTGVRINGDLITANTLVADKLVILGDDGLYYKLNTDGVTVESQQTNKNSLNGQVIIAKSISANKINVTDLQAFGATIGGFNLTGSSLYSGSKTSASNTTRGIYLGNDAQIAFGDASNYIRYVKDSSGNYKLEVTAGTIKLGTTNVASTTDVSTAKSEAISAASSDATTKANNALSGAISAASSDATAKANNALSGATAVANDLFNNLEIGGRNYFSNNPQNSTGNTVFNSENEFTLTTYQNVGSFNQFFNLVVPMSYFVGKKVRLSFDCISPNGPTPLSVYNTNGNPRYAMSTSGVTTPIDNAWTHQDIKITVTDRGDSYSESNSNKIEMYASSKVGVKIRNVKFEIGDKSTDWTPAPEDTYDKFEDVEASISLLDGRITSNVTATTALGTRTSALEQTSNGFSARLTTAETNITSARSAASAADTKATNAQTAANAANTNALNAAKTATNYLNFDSNGLLIGNLTGTLGENVLIRNTGVDIRDGANVLASFSQNLIELGKDSTNSTIQLCGNTGTIAYDSVDGYLDIRGKTLRLRADNSASLYTRYSSGSIGKQSAANVFLNMVELYSMDSTNLVDGVGIWRTSSLQITPERIYGLSDSLELYSRYGTTIETVSGDISLNATNVKSTRGLKVLWSGVYYMLATQTATLSEKISDQLVGVVFHWQYYNDGTPQNSHHVYSFLPKTHVMRFGESGVSFFLTNVNADIAGTKYLFISDQSITGNSNNGAALTTRGSGIRTTNNNWVLTEVLGV